MDGNTKIRRNISSYLVLFSGIQILAIMYYIFDVAKRRNIWKKRLGNKNFYIFRVGVYLIFFNGFFYHCLSKPLYRGTSGFSVQYYAIAMNSIQLMGIVCFFTGIMHYAPEHVYSIIQFFIYIPTFLLGMALNYFGWEPKKPQRLTTEGSWVASRRRDWGMTSTISSASLLVMLAWEVSKCIYDKIRYKKLMGELLGLYYSSFTLMSIGGVGIHVLVMKVSKGVIPCHQKLNIICIVFDIIETVGLALYTYVCNVKDLVYIAFYHVFFFSLATVISTFGNSYISRKNIKAAIEEIEMDEEL